MSVPENPAPPEPSKLARPDGSVIAYHKSPGRAPGIVFLGGFMSDMTGGKALALEAHARAQGQAFLRFDYQGHGASSGRFEEGCIGLWAGDAVAALDELTEGPQLLVGSSMGGWIMLLAALARPARVAGLVGIAAAPDFTEDLMWDRYPPEARRALEREGLYLEPSDYGEAPYPITMKLIEDGRDHLLLRGEIALDCPARLIHGMADPDVPWQTSLRLTERLRSGDVEITLVKGGGHRLSEPEDLERLTATLKRLIARLD
ncbi:MAG: alpha/beta hydrolase [Rhodospirillales bacterium]|nr:alpha/beta hydrolase [Rhodospirillales bacterium]